MHVPPRDDNTSLALQLKMKFKLNQPADGESDHEEAEEERYEENLHEEGEYSRGLERLWRGHTVYQDRQLELKILQILQLVTRYNHMTRPNI